MKSFLKKIHVIQEFDNRKTELKKGRGFFEAYRLNPFHPLSYATFIIYILLGIILYGGVGFWKESDLRNPFKWQ